MSFVKVYAKSICLFFFCIFAVSTLNASAARNELIIGQTLSGAYFGFSYFNGIDFADDRLGTFAPLSGALGGGGLGAASSIILSDEVNISTAQAQLVNSLSFWGAASGYLLGEIFFEDNRTWLTSGLVGAASTLLGANWAFNSNPNSSTIAVTNSAALWGALWGLQISSIMHADSIFAALLIGAGLTSLLGFLPRAGSYSRATVAQNDLSGLAGGLIGLATVSLGIITGDIPSLEIWLAGSVIGSIIGLVIVWAKTPTEKSASTLGTAQQQITIPLNFRY